MAVNILSPEKAAEILNLLGYFVSIIPDSPPVTLEQAISQYQKEHSLSVTGNLDSQTERSLIAVRFCSLPESFAVTAAAGIAKWPKKNITWSLSSTLKLSSFSIDDLSDVFKWCFKNWSDVCDLSFQQQAHGKRSNINITSGRIDSPGNTLAWSELANGDPNAELDQKYGTEENFVFSANPRNNEIDLGATGTHEIGHAIGISHIPGNTGDLMNAILSKFRTPQAGDIKQAVARYGIPISPSVPSPTSGPQSPLTPIIPIPYDPAAPDKKIFPTPLALPPLAGYTWVCLPNAFFPNSPGVSPK